MGEYPYFPMFVDLSEKHVLVVGAGKIASRRIKTLVLFTPFVTVTAPEALPGVKEMAEAGKITLMERNFREEDLDGADIVIAASDDAPLNAQIFRECRKRGIPVNVSSEKELCDFYFPGVVRTDRAVVGVTASGKDHRAAKEVTDQIRRALQES